MLSVEDFIHLLSSSTAPIGPILFVIFTASTVLCLPASWLTFACGALLGLGPGTVVANLSAVASAAITRGLARSRLGQWIDTWLNRRARVRLIRQALNDGGWKLAFIVRLSPALPLGASNWVFAYVDLPLSKFLLITSLATLPAQLMWVHFGVTGRKSLELWRNSNSADPTQWAFVVLSILATLASIAFLGVLSRRRLQQELKQQQN